MAKYSIEDTTLTNIADAIRTKTGSSSSIMVQDMASEITGIETGIDTSDATATADKIFLNETAYGKTGKITGMFTIDEELTEQDNLISQIATLVATKANPQGGADVSGVTATPSDVLSGKKFVDSAGTLQTGTIVTKTLSNLTASGATVTVPAGYYASQATKSISSGSAKTPATTITKNPTISIDSAGKITASVSGTQSVTPTVSAGYVSSGTAGTITISGSATKQLTTKAATTYTPTTSDQTIASGTYLTGIQTIKGDANLVASNIKSGVSIFGVSGSYEGSGSGGSSSGGAIETITITHIIDMPDPGMEIIYLDGTMTLHQEVISDGESTYTILKDSMVILINYPSNTFDGLTFVRILFGARLFLATGGDSGGSNN